MRDFAQQLDWRELVTACQELALSEPAKKATARLDQMDSWAQTVAEAMELQTCTADCQVLLDKPAIWNGCANLSDPTSILTALRKGRTLEVEELVVLRDWMTVIRNWTEVPREILPTGFRKMTDSLTNVREPLAALNRMIGPDGKMRENASKLLDKISREKKKVEREIEKKLEVLRDRYRSDGHLQGDFQDYREGHYIIPVKITAQNKVPGVVHGSSVSRQTVYIEPAEVRAHSDALLELNNEWLQEVFRLLTELSAKLAGLIQGIDRDVESIVIWDVAQAKARLGRRYGGNALQVSLDRTIELRDTANPLLWWSLKPNEVVRNSLFLESPYQGLLITGPNTGGKTVLLKTIGLASICGRNGFLFPGVPPLRIPFFDQFYVDVGDPQSIGESVSSFSGRLALMRETLTGAGGRSLVLLDELNTATDPDEGSALARSFIESLLERKSPGHPVVIATTHDPKLKLFASQDRRILCAGMMFDEEMSVPTYEIQLGVPGRSRAIDTALRLGLPAEVVRRAEGYLSDDQVQMELLLAQLENDAKRVQNEKRQAIALRQAAQKERQTWSERTKQKTDDLLAQVQKKLRQKLVQAQDEIKQSVKRASQIRSHKDVAYERQNIRSVVQSAQDDFANIINAELPELKLSVRGGGEVAVGDWVRVPKWKTRARVLSVDRDRALIESESGLGLKMKVALSEIEPTDPPHARVSTGLGIEAEIPEAVGSQLDLRGVRFEEAMAQLEEYLDRAFRSALPEVTIVHGVGTGALREGTRDLLGRTPYVKNFQDGGPGRGGTGATVVQFDR